MTYTIESTIYTFSELAEMSISAHRIALNQLRGRAGHLFWYDTFPELLNAFQKEHSQPYLEAEIDVYPPFATARGLLEVPIEMTRRWAEDDGPEVTRIPVGEFHSMIGWASRIGGEMYYWVPEEDGETLDEILKSLMRELASTTAEAFENATSDEALQEFAESRSMLFDEAGNIWGTTEDLP